MTANASECLAVWLEQVLATIDAQLQSYPADATALGRALAPSALWPHCPSAEQLSTAASPGYRRLALTQPRTADYSAVLIVWPAGYETSVHDHDGLWGVEVVLDGVLEVEDFLRSATSPPQLVSQTALTLHAGQAVAFSHAGHAHRCRNPSTDRPALTLHVYGGELTGYQSFSREEGRNTWRLERQTVSSESSLTRRPAVSNQSPLLIRRGRGSRGS